jgi:phosphate transport system permease protein
MSASASKIDGARSKERAQSFGERLIQGDNVANLIVFVAAASIVVITVWVIWELYENSSVSRHAFGWAFLYKQDWDPVREKFGALPFVFGTVVSAGLALLMAIPFGVGAAIFLAELAPPPISDSFTFLIELLAAVPSVIFGLLGIFVLIPMLKWAEPFIRGTLGFLPLFQGPFYGVSMLTAGFVLAVMIVPFIISISREVLLAVPADQREAAMALGATKWESTWDVVVPYARKGILGSIFLALARSLGETMAVTMVIGNDPKIHVSLFAPGYSIAAVIANEFAEASSDILRHSLIEMGLILFALTFLINGLARLMILTTTRKGTT